MKKFATGLIMFVCQLLQAQNTLFYQTILRSNAQQQTLCDGRVIPIYGITGSLSAPAKIPARILYCNEGDSVVLKARNVSQGEHHTIHLHGLDVDTRNDGDPSTSFWLEHMQDTTYSFKATHAGTYLYHCHAADVVHVQMGMYGMIVVRAAGGTKNAWTGGPSYHKDYKWLMSEIDSVWHYHVPEHDPVMDTVHIPKYVPHYFLVNGKCAADIASDDSIQVKGAQHEKIYLRLANIGYLSNRVIFPSWANAQILDSDGRPLPNAITSDTCFIMPGERFGVMLQPSIQSTASIALDYIDMNTGLTVYSEPVPITITGVIGISEHSVHPAPVQIFPNPASDFIRIVLQEPHRPDRSYRVYDAKGQKICEVSAREEGTLNVSAFPSGLYFLQVLEADGLKASAKFIIAR